MRLDLPAAKVLPDRARVLARAGCPPGKSDGLDIAIREALDVLERSAEPVAVFRSFPVETNDGNVLRTGELELRSRDLCSRLRGASSVSLFAVTIGRGPEREAAGLSADGEHLAAYFLDAAAAVAVEELCRRVHEEVSRTLPGQQSTVRYAPGYGDFHLSDQRIILDRLEARGIGITLDSDSFTLMPLKSATGVIGWLRRND